MGKYRQYEWKHTTQISPAQDSENTCFKSPVMIQNHFCGPFSPGNTGVAGIQYIQTDTVCIIRNLLHERRNRSAHTVPAGSFLWWKSRRCWGNHRWDTTACSENGSYPTCASKERRAGELYRVKKSLFIRHPDLEKYIIRSWIWQLANMLPHISFIFSD